MVFFRDYIRNIFLLVLVFVGAYIFMKVFYPDTTQVFGAVMEVYTVINFWPLVILALLVFVLPRRRR